MLVYIPIAKSTPTLSSEGETYAPVIALESIQGEETQSKEPEEDMRESLFNVFCQINQNLLAKLVICIIPLGH